MWNRIPYEGGRDLVRGGAMGKKKNGHHVQLAEQRLSHSHFFSYMVTVVVCTVEATSWDRERRLTGEIHIKGM
jgi:hypothetical protein